MNQRVSCVLPMLAAVLFLALRPAAAEIIHYQQLIGQNAGLVHHWNFEGATDAERRQDKASSANLIHLASSGLSPDYDVAGFAVPGFDASSTAVRTKRTSRTTGAGFGTASGVALGDTVHVEAIFQPTASSFGGVSGPYVGYVVANRTGSGASTNRGYFLMQGGPDEDTENLNLLAGDWSTSATENVLSPLIAGNWYFYSASFVWDGSGTTVNAWIADLNAANPALSKVVDDVVLIGQSFTRTSAPLCIGNGTFVGGTDSFPGLIDEVAIFNTALSAATVEAHFNAIMVPEPSGFVLMLFGLAALALVGGRRRPGK